jgi:hypothetical protein
VALLVSVVANDLFAVGPAFEEMVEDFRPLMTDEAIAQMRSDIAAMGVVHEEFTTQLLPAVAGQLGVPPEQFAEQLNTAYPSVAQGLAVMPQAGEQFVVVADTLDANQENFASADAIPTTSLPATSVPWGMTLAGLACIIVGAVMFFTARIGAVIAIILGLALVIVPFALSLPEKAADADQLNENLEPVYTEELVVAGGAAVQALGAMGAQLQTETLPDLATQLGLAPEELQAFLGENFPATAAMLGGFEEMLGRFSTTVAVFEANLDNYETLKPVAFVPIVWTIIIGGAVVLIAGIVALIIARREPAEAKEEEPELTTKEPADTAA